MRAGSGKYWRFVCSRYRYSYLMTGSITDVSALTGNVCKERLHQETLRKVQKWVLMACIFHRHFENGLRLSESTRWRKGHKALYTFEINGEHALSVGIYMIWTASNFLDHADDSSFVVGVRFMLQMVTSLIWNKWWVPGLSIIQHFVPA